MYNEKRKPHYDLKSFQASFSRAGGASMTKSASDDAGRLGFKSDGVAVVIQSMQPSHFYKSMSANCDHLTWQDVYHVPFVDMVLYVKFTADRISGFQVLSFKEK